MTDESRSAGAALLERIIAEAKKTKQSERKNGSKRQS